jgi:hypothetical protein
MELKVEKERGTVRLTLEASEVPLLRYALERALFIDTPVSEQVAIAAFCTRALELLKPRAS